MRISKAQIEANRARVLAAASELFRAGGFEGVSVAEVMGAAALTHGGFYNHFPSKTDLAVAALDEAWSAMAARRQAAGGLPQLLASYLSQAARDAPGRACPAAALASEMHRQPAPVRQTFAEGLQGMIASLEAELAGDPATRRDRAVALATRMIGALMLSRAAPDGSELATELLAVNLKAALAEAAAPAP